MDVRNAISSVDRALPLDNMRTLEQALAESVSIQRFSMSLLALFAALALSLAVVGIYGVTAYTVAQRTHELGVRLAMGARPSDVLRLVLGEGLRLGLAGAAAGVLGGLALTRLMANLLYGVRAADPLVFAAVATLLQSVALLACCVPARRAMKVDPAIALRCE